MRYFHVKTIFDKVIALILLIILSPLMFVVLISIRLESKGKAIFRQERIGYKGKVFMILKFRSMKIGAEADGVYEKKGDTRVTKVGKFIRKTSIDELPQLINIIKGDMSIIGPRPTLTYHPWIYEDYTDFQKLRFSVKPGVTGLAQINGRKDVQWVRRIEYDVQYVENIRLVLDIKIFLITILKVIGMKDNMNINDTTKTTSTINEVDK